MWIEFKSDVEWILFDLTGPRARSPGHLSIVLTPNLKARLFARRAVYAEASADLLWDGGTKLSLTSTEACNYGWKFSSRAVSRTHFVVDIAADITAASCSPASAMSRDRYAMEFKNPLTTSARLYVLFDDGTDWMHPFKLEGGKSVTLSLPAISGPDLVFQADGYYDCAKRLDNNYKDKKFTLVDEGKDVVPTINPPAGTGAVPVTCTMHKHP